MWNDCLFFAGPLLQLPPQSPLAHSNIAPCHAAPCHAVYPWSQQQPISSVMPRVPSTLPCTPYPSARPAQPALVSSPPNLPQFPPLWWLTCTLPFNFLVHKALIWCYFQTLPHPTTTPISYQLFTGTKRYSHHTLLCILKGKLCFKASQLSLF